MTIQTIPQGSVIEYVGNTLGRYQNEDMIGMLATVLEDHSGKEDITIKVTFGNGAVGVMPRNIKVISTPEEDALPEVPNEELYTDKYGDTILVERSNESGEDLLWLTAKDKHGEAILEFTDRNAVLDLASHLMRIGLHMNKEC